MSLIGLQKKLRYEFNNKELLELALVHKSSNNSLNNPLKSLLKNPLR